MKIRHSRSEILARAPRLGPDRFRLDRDGGRLVIEVPVRREWYRILLSAVWLCLLVAFQVALVLVLAGEGPAELAPGVLTKSTVGALLGLSVLGGALLVWRILWSLWGREEFLMDSDTMSIRRAIGRMPIGTRRFPRAGVRNPRAAPLRYHVLYPAWGRPFVNHEEHQLSFDVDRWTYHAARGLTQGEAEHLADLLRENLQGESLLRHAS